MYTYTKRKCTVNSINSQTSRPSDTLRLTIGVFFDGTRNNKYNINFWEAGHTIKDTDKENYKKYKKIADSNSSSYDSYKKNKITNVAKLWYIYDTINSPNSIKVYVEGPGTYQSSPQKKEGTRYNDEEGKVSSGKSDATLGLATAKGETGINAKIETGCQLVAEQISSKLNERTNTQELHLTFDVFGFSRGAAAARSFVSRMFLGKVKDDSTDSKEVCLEQHLRKYGINRKCSKIYMSVRFLGLFDTVSSYGINFSDDVQELALKVPFYVSKTVHLVAADEYRDNFDLTNVASAGEKAHEIIIPGAHGDVGGGYCTQESEYMFVYDYTTGIYYNRGNISREELHKRKWISDDLYKKWENGEKNFWGVPKGIIREVKNDYAKIPLFMMGEYATNTKILLKKDVSDVSTALSNPILLKLRNVLLTKRLYKLSNMKITKSKDYANYEGIVDSIRADYIHLSAANNDMVNKAAKNNIRTIHNG